MSADKPPSADNLRERAEALLAKSSDVFQPEDIKDVNTLAHELAVHQAELELQNEELRTTQLALQQTRDRYAALFENAPVGYVVLDAAGIIRQTNATWRSMLGRPDQDFRDTAFADTLLEEDASIFLSRFRTFFRNPAEKQIVVRIKRCGAEPFYGQIEAAPRDADTDSGASAATPWELLVIVSDITARKQAEEALRASEELHRTTLASIGDAVISTDADGNAKTMNAVAEQLTGWPSKDAAGRPLTEVFRIVNAKTRKTVENPVAKVIASGQIVGLANHTLLIARDGSERQIADSAAPIRDDADKILGVVLVFRDVTEEYAAAERLRNSEADLRQAQRVAQVGSWRFDLNTNSVTASEQARRIYGLGDQELTIAQAQGIPLEKDRQMLDEALRALVETGADYDLEFSIRRVSDGEIRNIHSAAEYDPEANVVVGTIQDVTEQTRLFERLRHMEKMDAIGQLAGGVAHDFNNQLGGIMGYAEMLAARLEEPGLRRYAANILTCARRAEDLTAKLLAFARKGKYQSVCVDMHAIIHEVVDFLSHSIDKKIEIKQFLTADPCFTQGDPNQLQNTLLNLAINAADAMQGGGELVFETANRELDAGYCAGVPYKIEPGPYLHICLSDTGCGIPQENLDHIFEPFFTTKEVGKGTGMGLAAVYGTVKQHGGAINVYSEVGRGTTFRLYLPLESGETVAEKQAAETVRAPREAAILVLEDEQLIRAMTEDMLVDLGYRVTTRENGESGLAYFREHWREIDLVILDMVMPLMSGPEAFRAMKEIDPDVKVLLASGYSAGGAARELLAEGVRGFLQKPFTLAELSTKVADTIQSTPE
jgi:PAS domain S-box-containing protein